LLSRDKKREEIKVEDGKVSQEVHKSSFLFIFLSSLLEAVSKIETTVQSPRFTVQTLQDKAN